MSDYAKLSAPKLHKVIAARYARYTETLDATLRAGMGDLRHSDLVELAKGSSLLVKSNLARDYLNARHDWKVVADELDARRDYHGSDKPIKRPA